DVPLVLLGRKHGKPIVVFARNGDVPHARGLRQRNDLRGAKSSGVELRRELFVFGDGDLLVLHHPFATSRNAVHTPMNKHAELRVLKPLPLLEVGLGRLIVLRCSSQVPEYRYQQERQQSRHFFLHLTPHFFSRTWRATARTSFLTSAAQKPFPSPASVPP